MEEFKANPLLSGITFSGGEPFCQAGALADLAEEIISLGKNITVYSGYTFEQLYEMAKEDKDIMRLLSLADVLIDGKFIMSEKTLLLRFRGSKNQRMLILKRPWNQTEKRSILLSRESNIIWSLHMKKLLSIILSIIICAVSVQGVFAESSDVDINTERNVYDDCADFSKVVAYSEGLSLDVVTDENKYAFSGDDTQYQ